MKSFAVGDRRIGEGAPVFLIAELSANHGGDLGRALRTIEAAAKAGADAIKIQTYTPDTLTLKSDSPLFVVQTKNEWGGRTLHDLYAEAMTPWEWHAELKACAEAAGLVFFSTPFDATAVEFLEGLGVVMHKIASFELADLPLVENAARRGKPMILSTGMASLGEIEAAVRTCREAGNDAIALLRCVSAYPAKPQDMALASYGALASFGTVVGLSDHTRDATVAIASVALGAKVIEKHFILDRSAGGPDAFFSLEPGEFRAMVTAVRDTEAAMGTPRFGPAPDETASTTFRRSLFFARDVEAGQILTCDDVRSVRPAHGLPPASLPEVLGRPAARAATAATPLTWDAVGPAAEPGAVELRRATRDDGAALLAWRNDPATRAASVNSALVTQDEHATWLRRTLDSNDRVLLVAWQDDVRVGQVRLDRGPAASAEISITVAPEARGRRLATPLLRHAEREARALGIRVLTARIRPDNDTSMRAFKKAGYYAFARRGDGLLGCERRLVPFR